MNDLQRAARTRKLAYLGLIVGLFTLSMFWRGGLALPFGDPTAADPLDEVARRLNLRPQADDFRAEAARRLGLDATAADFDQQACAKLNVPYRTRFERALDRVARLPISQQATSLELSEMDMGDPEIAGSAARVSLVGFRGVVVTVLWSSAIEKQKRNEWHDFELYARLVTRLQPNFITPWLFQGWNIAFNVSVENEKLGDMFFFIARGIELLSEGDKLNTKTVRRRGQTFAVGSPDLRREVAFFYQNKFTVSDKVTTLRCLMALTVMKPDDRSPARILKQNTAAVNDAAFRQFCEENPQLVRRLMTPRPNPTLGEKVTDTIAATPLEIADFLAANTDLPTRWDKSGRPKEADAQFPTLPPAFAGDAEYHPGHPDLTDRYDRFDALVAARAWFQYAQLVVPPPPADKLPAAAPKRPRDYDPADPDAEYKYRMPQYPAIIIFRYYPARAQSYLAERLQKEGWYDADTAWDPDAGKAGDDRWFKDRPAALKAQRNSLAEWAEADRRWADFGRDNGLNPSPEVLTAMEAAYRKTLATFPPGSQLPDELSPEQAERVSADDIRLRKARDYLPQNLSVTNYRRFQDEAQAESTREMVTARKRLLAAEALRTSGALGAAAEYAAAIAEWRGALARQQKYHQGDRSDPVHEFSFDLEQKLTTLYKDDPAVVRQVAAALTALQAVVPAVAPTAVDPTLPADPLGTVAATRKDLLQTIAEELAVTEVAVRMRMQAGVVEAEARKQVADDKQFGYLKRYTAADRQSSWVRPDIREAKLRELGFFRPPTPAGPPPETAGGPPQVMPGSGSN